MPFDPSTGDFTRVANSFSDPVTGTVIAPTDADGLFDDYDAGLTQLNVSLGNGGVELYVATGQSNFSRIPALAWSPPANAQVWNNTINDPASVGTAFIALPNNVITPEYAFVAARARKFPNKSIFLVIMAKDNLPIANWLSGYAGHPVVAPDMYAALLANMVPALNVILGSGVTTASTIKYWQAENDAAAGSTTWLTDFETLVTRFKAETWYPLNSSPLPNLIIYGIVGRSGAAPSANADNFNQTYILPAASADPGKRWFVNSAGCPTTYYDFGVPGHLNALGYYNVGTLVGQATYTDVPGGLIYTTGTSTPTLNAVPQALSNVNAVWTLNNNAVAMQPPISDTLLQMSARNATVPSATFDGFGGGLGFTLLGRYAEGTQTTPTATNAARILTQIGGQGYESTNKYTTSTSIRFLSLNAQTNTDHSGEIELYTTPSGSTTLTRGAKVHASGGFSVGSAVADPGAGSIRANVSLIAGDHTSATTLSFKTNGTTYAGAINTSQQWVIGPNAIAPNTGSLLTVTKNTSTPAATVTATAAVAQLVGVDGTSAELHIQSFGTSAVPAVRFGYAQGTGATPTAAQTNNALGANFGYGFKTAGGSVYVASAGFIYTATDNFTATTTGGRVDFYGTATGTTGIALAASIGAGLMVGNTTDLGAGTGNFNTFVKTGATTVGALPAAAAGNRGARWMVTDANATMTAGIGAVVAAGGANVVPVYSDGAAWRIG